MRRYNIGPDGIPAVVRRITNDFGLPTRLDEAVILAPKYINSFRVGRKKWTAKFHREQREGGTLTDVIRLPKAQSLPLLDKGAAGAQVGTLYFDCIKVLQFKDITESIAQGDGEANLRDFQHGAKDLARARGFELLPETYGSLYLVESIDWI